MSSRLKSAYTQSTSRMGTSSPNNNSLNVDIENSNYFFSSSHPSELSLTLLTAARSRLISQFNQLLLSLLIPVTIPFKSSKIPAKLLLKTFESLLEIRFDTLAVSPSTSVLNSSPTSSKSPGLSSAGRE